MPPTPSDAQLESAHVEVWYFAQAARAVGVDKEQFDLSDEMPLEAFRLRVLERHPVLRPLAESLLWSIDEQMARAIDVVRPGQRIGVMPPFSGG